MREKGKERENEWERKRKRKRGRDKETNRKREREIKRERRLEHGCQKPFLSCVCYWGGGRGGSMDYL